VREDRPLTAGVPGRRSAFHHARQQHRGTARPGDGRQPAVPHDYLRDRARIPLPRSGVCTALCFLVIFSNQFSRYYSDFLGILIIWLCPWFAIYAVDALLRRQRYDAQSLVDTSRRSRYWRNGGFFLPGVIAQVLGMAAAAMWISATAFQGPLSAAVGGSDFSVFTGLGVAGLVYWLLARRAVAAETASLAAVLPEVSEAAA
jgi:purine-cytosine permease-like protein